MDRPGSPEKCDSENKQDLLHGAKNKDKLQDRGIYLPRLLVNFAQLLFFNICFEYDRGNDIKSPGKCTGA